MCEPRSGRSSSPNQGAPAAIVRTKLTDSRPVIRAAAGCRGGDQQGVTIPTHRGCHLRTSQLGSVQRLVVKDERGSFAVVVGSAIASLSIIAVIAGCRRWLWTTYSISPIAGNVCAYLALAATGAVGVLVATRWGDQPLRAFGVARWPWRRAATIGFLGSAAGAAYILIVYAGLADPLTTDGSADQFLRTHLFLSAGRVSATTIGLIIISSTCGPLAEESVFRGLWFAVLRRWGMRDWACIGVTAATFHVVHVVVYGLANHPYFFVLGMAFGLVFQRTGSLLCAFLAHAGYNLGVFLTKVALLEMR